MDRSPGFGSTPQQLKRPIKTRFSLRLPYSVNLATECKSLTPLYKRYAVTPRRCSHCLYACGFQDLFHSPHRGSFSPFPHGTGSLSVSQEYLALEDGPPIFRQGFTCLALLVIIACAPFVYGNITLYVRTSQSVPLEHTQLNGLLPVRSPLLRESQLISFPKGTEMFHFPSFASITYVFSY